MNEEKKEEETTWKDVIAPFLMFLSIAIVSCLIGFYRGKQQQPKEIIYKFYPVFEPAPACHVNKDTDPKNTCVATITSEPKGEKVLCRVTEYDTIPDSYDCEATSLDDEFKEIDGQTYKKSGDAWYKTEIYYLTKESK